MLGEHSAQCGASPIAIRRPAHLIPDTFAAAAAFKSGAYTATDVDSLILFRAFVSDRSQPG